MEEMNVVHKKKVVTPKLRFKGFNDGWIETKLNDVAKFEKGKGISKSDIVADGELECIRYGELYTTYNELIENVISKTNLPIKELLLSEYNDVIIPSSGETQLDIATASCVLKSGVALGGDLNIIRSSLNGIFLSFYLNNKKKHDIARLAQGSSVVHLYNSQLQSLKLNIPALPEQQKIASFLSAVDEKIAVQTQCLASLRQYKKGVMQQLFSGKLRFKDENGKAYPKWEEKKLGDVISIFNGYAFASADATDSGCKWVKIADVGINEMRQDAPSFLPDDYKSKYAKFLLRKGDYVIALTRPILNGKLKIAKINDEYDYSLLNQRVGKLTTNYNLTFAYYLIQLKELISKIENSIAGTDPPNLSPNEINSIKITIPTNIEEQKKIADFLSAIDVKIEKVSKQINQTQTFKKGLLQQMFV